VPLPPYRVTVAEVTPAGTVQAAGAPDSVIVTVHVTPVHDVVVAARACGAAASIPPPAAATATATQAARRPPRLMLVTPARSRMFPLPFEFAISCRSRTRRRLRAQRQSPPPAASPASGHEEFSNIAPDPPAVSHNVMTLSRPGESGAT
jgi:hypothetical protein